MRHLVLLLIVFIFAVRSAPDHKRTVNVALETSLLFEPKDLQTNIGLVNNVRSFLDKIYETLKPQAELTFRETKDPKTLPDFLEHLGSIFLNFSSDGIHNVADDLREHMYSCISNSRSSYHEIFTDPTLKKTLKDAVEQFSSMDGEKLKRKLHKFIRSDKPVLRSFTKRLNKFYTEEDLSTFYKFAKKLDKYVNKKKDPRDIVKEWLDFGIFDRFNKLNSTAKEKLLYDLTLVTDYFNGDTRFRAEDEFIDKSNEEDVSGSDGEDVHKHHRHSHKKETVRDIKNSGSNSKEKYPDCRKTEVIVDNVEFFIKPVQD